jgi:hypothetical protein
MASQIPLGRAIAALSQVDDPASPEERRTRRQATLEAYAWLDHTPQGALILEDLALRLTNRCETDYDEGARRLVLEIFKAIADGKRATEKRGA